MADFDKNKPTQDPENLENEINTSDPIEEVAEAPAEETPVEETTEEVAEAPAEETPVEETTEEVAEAPAEEAPVEEITEEVAEVPAEEAPVEETTEEVAEAPAEEAPVEETAEEVAEAPAEETPVEETTEEVAEAPAEEAPAEETTEEVAEAPAEEAPVEETAEEVAEAPAEETPVEETTEEVAEPAEEEDLAVSLKLGIGENGEIYVDDSDEKSESDGEDPDGGDGDGPDDDWYDEDEVDPEDLVIHEGVVEAIKAAGARLTNSDYEIKAYLKRSKAAIKSLESALKVGQNTLDANRDEKEAPAILVGIIKICGKILEIKCDNLENIARIHAHNYIKEARTALHYEIDRYNDLVITYASLTGEQLTRLSTFLPENIASGKALAVVPSLSYVEAYVQVDPDVVEREDDVHTMVINPVLSADNFIGGDTKPPKGRSGAARFTRKVKKGTKQLNREEGKLTKLISDTKVLRKRYESELQSLEASTPVAMRTTTEYKDKVLAIKLKYGKKLAGINTVKASSAFARTKMSLVINRMAIEREKLVLAYENARVAYREGKISQRREARRLFEEAINSYNKLAELTTKATGCQIELLPDALVEYANRSSEITFPVLAYRRRLVETVGASTRVIAMTLRSEIAPNEAVYNENSEKVLEKRGSIRDTSSLSVESTVVDRASAVAKVMLEALRESADIVITADELDQFEVKARRATKYFKRALKATERAIARGFDDNAVITALVENLRVIANLIEVKRLNVAVAKRLNRTESARHYGRSLYKYIELYNGRAIDYMSIVGERFSRITLATSKELVNTADKLKVPVITYKDNYIEVFPKDPLQEATFEKPKLWRGGVYTPLMMHHYRLTENRAVETTVINSPFVFDVVTDDLPTVSWWHPIGLWQHLFVWAQPIVAWARRIRENAEIWFVEESLLFSRAGIQTRQGKNDKKKSKFERKLDRLNKEHDAAILKLETVVHESDRQSASYQKKLYKINTRFSRKVYNLRVRWSKTSPCQSEARLLLERLVLERERLTGINKVLLKYRSYGRVTFLPNVLVRYKKSFINAINAHNQTAEKLSEMIGVKFSQVSTSVADEIIRYGKMIKFPQIVCCREVIETVDGKERTVGDKWHGYGLYTGTSGAPGSNGGAPVMSVGAMGYATEMGVPFLKSNFDGLTMLGMTPGGVPLIGFSQTGEASIPFTGTPMMLAGTDGSVVLDAGVYGQDTLILGAANVTDPHSGINRRGVDSVYTDAAEDEAKDIRSGCTVETPLDLETKMIEERFRKALRARSMTTVDNVANWWKQLFSEINVWLMRKLAVRAQGFLRVLLPPKYDMLDIVSMKLNEKDLTLLRYIARVGGIIEIECKRLYSATKTGIRRSQRVFSNWLHKDIEVYNKLVREFNSGHERHMHLETLSLNIPDTIRFRTEDRPPIPPILSLRNRVKLDDKAAPITTDEIYNKLVSYARSGAFRYAGPLRALWSKLVTIPLINFHDKHGHRNKVLKLVTGVILKRSARTFGRRTENELRHYYIRYEKARAMKRYNRRTLRAVGVAGDPIKYQTRVHRVLRRYLSTNFRIDYNMRIRQLIYRALSMDATIYWVGTLALAVAVAICSLFMGIGSALHVLVIVALAWSALPIALLLLRIVYEIVMLIASLFLLLTRNIVLIKHGGIDIERNRYGTILDCFVSEQYRLLLACEMVRQKPKSVSARKRLIATVNDYNKRAKVYSELLRVPIRTIETTTLIEKLASGENHRLPELENFTYVRELIERVDAHEVGKKLDQRELGTLVEEINQIINGINLAGSENQVAVDFLQGAMQRLIGYLQTEIKPTQNDKFELKRDLIQGIAQFEISAGNKELFIRNVIKVVDQLGGKNTRKIIGILAEDDMIL